MPIIAWFMAAVPALLARLVPFLGSLVVQLLVLFGFSFTVVQGLDAGFDYFIDQVGDSFAGFPSDTAAIFGLAGVDVAVNMILTAHLFALGVTGLKGGSKMVGGFNKKGGD